MCVPEGRLVGLLIWDTADQFDASSPACRSANPAGLLAAYAVAHLSLPLAALTPHHCCCLTPVARTPVQADGAQQLEQFLHDDLNRFMELRQHLDEQASASDAAVLASGSGDDRARRLSSGSTNSGISFVRLPDEEEGIGSEGEEEEGEDGAASQPHLAATFAAAAAMAAVSNMAAAPCPVSVSQQTELAASASTAAAAAAAAAAACRQQGASSTHSTATAAAASFVMEADEEIAAQKRAARARMAELEGCPAQQELESAGEAATSSAKACPDWGSAYGDGAAAGSMLSSRVPERPRGLAAMPPPSKPVPALGYRLLFKQLVGRLYELSMLNSEGVVPEHSQFLQQMVAGLLLCVVLLPVLWLLQADGGRGTGIVRGMLPAALIVKAELACNALYVGSAVGVLLYCLVRSARLPTPLLHFSEPALERQYLLWSNSGRLFQDCLFQLTFLVVGSCLWLRLLQSGSTAAAAADAVLAAAPSGQLVLSALTLVGAGLPVGMLLLLRSPRYMEWREPVLSGSRLCSVLALSLMQLTAGVDVQLQLNMPFIALAQVMSIACMQVRLSSFVPTQVLQLLVLLLCTRAVHPLLQFTQLFGGWLCLPCLILYSMEMHSRKAFLATLAPAAPPSSSKAAMCSRVGV